MHFTPILKPSYVFVKQYWIGTTRWLCNQSLKHVVNASQSPKHVIKFCINTYKSHKLLNLNNGMQSKSKHYESCVNSSKTKIFFPTKPQSISWKKSLIKFLSSNLIFFQWKITDFCNMFQKYIHTWIRSAVSNPRFWYCLATETTSRKCETSIIFLATSPTANIKMSSGVDTWTDWAKVSYDGS